MAAVDGGPAAVDIPALYDVTIGHSRRVPVINRFRYRSYLWLTDLDHPPVLPRVLRSLARFEPSDHLDIRQTLREHHVDADRILMLTGPRVLGYVFNPITVYWCYGSDGELLAHVAEVHNTYGGRHAYVLHADERASESVNKEMYVSPFYPVDGEYRITVSPPGPEVTVSVVLNRPAGDTFTAFMRGRHKPATVPNLIRFTARYPLAPLRVRGLIQWQGLKLWRRGLEVQPR